MIQGCLKKHEECDYDFVKYFVLFVHGDSNYFHQVYHYPIQLWFVSYKEEGKSKVMDS